MVCADLLIGDEEHDSRRRLARDCACSALSFQTSELMRSFKAGAMMRRWRDHDSLSFFQQRC
jgi:hypothetical protein